MSNYVYAGYLCSTHVNERVYEINGISLDDIYILSHIVIKKDNKISIVLLTPKNPFTGRRDSPAPCLYFTLNPRDVLLISA